MFGITEISIVDILRFGISLLGTQHQPTNHFSHLRSQKEHQMTVFTIEKPAAQTNNAPAKGEAKEKSQIWLNVGINLPMPKADGTTENVFISLPFGLALDTMTKAESKGSSTEYAHMVQAKNWLLEQLQAAGNKLDAGQSQTIAGLELQMRRVGEAAQADPNQNAFLAQIRARFAA